MKVCLTGATGFLGRHLVPALVSGGHDIVALVRSPGTACALPWLRDVTCAQFEMAEPGGASDVLTESDALVHLAWQNLAAYRDPVHLDFNHPASLALVDTALEAGVRRIQIAGTCLEYGLVEGCLHESLEPSPVLAYPQGKDRLRRDVFTHAAAAAADIQWVRLFYLYGEGQNPRSLLAALEASIAAGEESFDMSGGDQVRDFAPVEMIAGQMAKLLAAEDAEGIFNCCSGRGVTVRALVEDFIAARGSSIRLNLGVYDYPDYEPLAFWGDNRRITAALNGKV